MTAFRKVAECLEVLRRQVNEMAPGRDTSSDGTLGDEAHQGRKSDHNPDADGVVTALDITHDPAHGVDAGALAEMLRVSQDVRIKYVISNRRIFSSKISPWQWRPYDGANAHTKHVHVSVMDTKALYEDTRPWAIDRLARIRAPLQGQPLKRFTAITATQFGGHDDPNTSAYDGHFITDEEFGVALPFHFKNVPRPKVRVANSVSGVSTVCSIVDVGPWNTDDPYWQTGTRPQAESGIDRTGRKTNLAGIDLTPAAARVVGIDGKGKVDWEFIGTPGETTMGTPANDLIAALQQVIVLLQSANASQTATPQPQPQAQPADQLKNIADLINAILNPGAKTDQPPPLGQVNGALGQTIGNALNGRKTAIGVIGSLLATVLPNIPGLSSALTPAVLAGTPIAPVALPIFLAMTAWGFLGKMEKWSGASPPPQK